METKIIPRAKEFIQNYIEENNEDSNLDIEDALIEFAKLHVEAALKKASEKFDHYSNKNAILSSYSLDNIK